MSILPALIGLHYHVAKLRGKAGDPTFAKWASKAKKAAANEAQLRPEQRILQRMLSPEAAVGILVKEHQALVAVNTAAKAAGVTPEHIDSLARALGTAERAKRIGGAAVAEAAHLHKQKTKDVAQAKRFGGLLKKLELKKNVHDKVEKSLQTATGDEYSGISNVLSAGDTFEWLQREIDSCGKTYVQATGTNTTRKLKLDEYARLADPSLWSTNNPDSFKLTYQVATERCPVVTDAPPQTKLLRVGGSNWSGGMFELAAPEIVSGEAPAQFRNLLNVKFNKGGDDKVGTIDIQYSLYESLTTSIFGDEYQGGIDADSGAASIVLLEAGGLTITGSKGIRFSDETSPFSASLNAIALPWLIWWMSDVILDGLEATKAP